mmetsp:Transcript_13224/g.41378  ORF Transcript_13224/g.41378 Transcript_13224/m.41378 type:complete len:230 (-) Transcript_13224:213-902(-)
MADTPHASMESISPSEGSTRPAYMGHCVDSSVTLAASLTASSASASFPRAHSAADRGTRTSTSPLLTALAAHRPLVPVPSPLRDTASLRKAPSASACAARKRASAGASRSCSATLAYMPSTFSCCAATSFSMASTRMAARSVVRSAVSARSASKAARSSALRARCVMPESAFCTSTTTRCSLSIRSALRDAACAAAAAALSAVPSASPISASAFSSSVTRDSAALRDSR